ncbi:hypothetical protein BOTBODRAFT_45130 [Botryobasidium botryosum FD-172 SS1]|uniref:Peptidase S8/S53 domain-containing protein n=1 Tax=Botryobasidium botryosum (strain FD-172 SS1) TaxID=930990 RepID=A0A067MD80_BOTB1|nr:hypothetical protein BOTBODRAFT_45130 [Botryobasidium botryosum FD-172 SS1]
MKLFIGVSLLACASHVFAAPALVPIQKVAGPVKTGSYIIYIPRACRKRVYSRSSKLKPGADKRGHLSKLAQILGTADSHVAYDYDNVFHGYAGEIKGAALAFIQASKDVEYIYPDGIASINYESGAETREVPGTPSDVHTLATDGEGVDIYSVDTGVYTAHNSFGGRARWGATFGGYANADGNGHGTHTAATAAGVTYGVAPSANVIAVKVLSDGGSGAWSDIIAGFNWVVTSAKSSGRPSIATVSLGGGATQAVDDAVNAAIAQGIHFTVSAGNNNYDTSNNSPARVAAANTIGASDSKNVKASFSNYGPGVDVFAPGVSILSAWIGSPSASNSISGTSMSTPFVAGILASVISKYGNKSPAALSDELKAHARPLVTGIPSGTTNLLATIW